MISLRVYIATLALAVMLDNVRAAYVWTSPVTFYYKRHDPHDYISVNIILQNIPAEADRYIIYHQTDNCDRSKTAQNPAGRCDVPARRDTIPTNRTIPILEKLDRGSLRIYIVLRNENEICTTKWIMDGSRDHYANVNSFHTECLNKNENLCDIIADFRNQSEEQRAKIHCSQTQGRLTCEVYGVELPEDTVHQWYQKYKDGPLIGNIPMVKGNKTEFKMTFLQFDSNSYISNVMNLPQFKKDLLTENLNIPPSPTNKYENYHVEHTMKYIENEQVSFNCSNNPQKQIGWIEKSGNKINMFNYTDSPWKLTKEDNGSMLCCLDYRYYTVGTKTGVERTVNNITVLLIYEEPVNQDNKVSPSDLPLYTSTSRPPEAEHSTPAVTSRTQHQEGPTSPSSQHSTDPPSDSPSDKTNYYIAIAVVAGIILLTSLTYVVIKKCCRKSYDPEQTLQLETYATTNMVLYAELDIRPGTGPAPASTEDATYAQIIGVLRPQNVHAKK